MLSADRPTSEYTEAIHIISPQSRGVLQENKAFGHHVRRDRRLQRKTPIRRCSDSNGEPRSCSSPPNDEIGGTQDAHQREPIPRCGVPRGAEAAPSSPHSHL